MRLSTTVLLIFVSVLILPFTACKEIPEQYEPTVESLQQYETPGWFNDAKFGIWICWNAYTVPAVGDWYARNMYIEGHDHYQYHLENYGHPSEFGYKDIIHLWKGEQFDAQALVDLFVETGARYIVGMANHHDNFDLWDSKNHPWNSVNYGPKRDIMGEFRDAVLTYKEQGIRWGITSHVERASCWFQTNKGADIAGPYAGVPYDGNDEKYQNLYLPHDPTGDVKPTQPSNAPVFWRENWLARCKDLFDQHDPDFFYVDGGVPFPGDDQGQTGLEMISYLYNQSAGRHGGTNEAVMCIKDWYKKAPKGEWGYYWDGIATLNLERARLPLIRKKPWQTDTSIGDWTYVKDGEYRSATEIIHELIDIVSKNGNMLLNVSPMANGTLDNQAYDLLKEIGAWMKVNGESIYETRPWKTSGTGGQRIVAKGNNLLYLSLMEKPSDNQVVVAYLAPLKGKTLGITSVSVLGHEDENVTWVSDETGLKLELPEGIEDKHAIVLKIEGESLDNHNAEPVRKLYDRSEELTAWWKTQQVTETVSGYNSVTVDNNNTVWAIKSDSTLVELFKGKETAFGIKALDVGASASGIVYIATDGSVYLHARHHLQWVELPEKNEQISHTGAGGKIWLKLPGIKAKRCDIGQTGTIWVIGQDNRVAYYNDRVWKTLDKKAEDIACGGGWVGCVAAISNGQLERFEGTHWENLGGADLKAVDISLTNEVIVALSSEGRVTVYDIMGSVDIDTGSKKFEDVSCGLKNNNEIVVLTK